MVFLFSFFFPFSSCLVFYTLLYKKNKLPSPLSIIYWLWNRLSCVICWWRDPGGDSGTITILLLRLPDNDDGL